jgi:hypothetical protein
MSRAPIKALVDTRAGDESYLLEQKSGLVGGMERLRGGEVILHNGALATASIEDVLID